MDISPPNTMFAQKVRSPVLSISLIASLSLGLLLLLVMYRDHAMQSRAVRRRANSLQQFKNAAAANLTAWSAQALKTHMQGFSIFNHTRDWELFKPIITCPPDRPLVKYGKNDGSKLLCKVDSGLKQREDCVIYSIGSNGDYQFEQAMLDESSCQIHTLDCTYSGKSLDKRHHYHKWCVGSAGANFRTWDNITKTLGHERVDILKMDVEGAEYAVLAGFRKEDRLPEEIAMEFHVRFPFTPNTAAGLAVAFQHMANLGYAAYSQEVNPLAPSCCCEFSFMRVSS